MLVSPLRGDFFVDFSEAILFYVEMFGIFMGNGLVALPALFVKLGISDSE